MTRSKYAWESIKDDLIRRHVDGESTVDLSKRFGIPRQTIADFLRNTGVLRTLDAARQNARSFDFETTGPTLLSEYLSGESTLTLASTHNIPEYAIVYFLKLKGVLRSMQQAARTRRSKGRFNLKPRECISCHVTYIPTGVIQKVCRTCTPDAKAERRYAGKGVTQPQWDALIKAQGGKCAIEPCNREPTVVDHDHKTMVVRGALCTGCNTALARLEIPGWTDAATEYLTKDTGFRVPQKAHNTWREGMDRERHRAPAL